MPIHADRILYQDDHFLAVHKLAGELVVRGKGEVGKLPLFDFLKKDYPGLHPLNRLDFDTSGIVLFARNRAVLKTMLEKRPPMRKVYHTLVTGDVRKPSGQISFPLPARSGEGDAPALTRYTVIERFGICTYLEVEIETGRHHQIRRHLQKIGHPLVNDSLYGDKKADARFGKQFKLRKFFLHAAELVFDDPSTGRSIHIKDPLPHVFLTLLRTLRA